MNDTSTSEITHYAVVGEFGGCRHKHRTALAAARCEESTYKAVKRMGGGAYVTARACAVRADGSTERVEWHRCSATNEPTIGLDPYCAALAD